MRVHDGSGLAPGLARPFEIAADASIRHHVARGDQGPSFYPLAGLRVGVTHWAYRNPVTAWDGDVMTTIDSDWIPYYAPYVGLGVAIVRTRRFHLGVHATGGVRFYESFTRQGFRNDVFRDREFGQLTLETGVRF
jgi:hypothetical protein